MTHNADRVETATIGNEIAAAFVGYTLFGLAKVKPPAGSALIPASSQPVPWRTILTGPTPSRTPDL